jgi:hypothetical protein
MNFGLHGDLDGGEGQDLDEGTTGGDEGGDLEDSQDSDTDEDDGEDEGEEGLDEEGDEDSESDEDDEDKEPEDDEEEEDQEEDQDPKSFKDPKSGNFDWKKINAKLGNGELEKAFKSSQAMITKTSQENKQLRQEYQQMHGAVGELQQSHEYLNRLDEIVSNNPEAFAAIQRAINGGGRGAGGQQGQNDPFAAFNENDPALPLLRSMAQTINQLQGRHQQEEHQRRSEHVQTTFRQGLIDAKEEFKSLVGRDATKEELRAVADKMQRTKHFEGRDFVASLFKEEVLKNARRSLIESRKAKLNLPKNPKGAKSSGRVQKDTSNGRSLKETFDEEWEKHMG